MGWGTYLYPQIYYSHEGFQSKYDVEEKLESAKKWVNHLKDDIRKYAYMTEPAKFMSEDDIKEGNSPNFWLDQEIDNLIESLDDAYYDVWKYEILLDNWDNCHDKKSGLAIAPPKEMQDWKAAFMDGDFVKTVQDMEKEEEKKSKSGSEGIIEGNLNNCLTEEGPSLPL